MLKMINCASTVWNKGWLYGVFFFYFVLLFSVFCFHCMDMGRLHCYCLWLSYFMFELQIIVTGKGERRICLLA